METDMRRIYLTPEELAFIPSFPPECVPSKPGVYWCPSEQGTKIHLVLVVTQGIANTLADVERVASHEERQARVNDDNARFAADSLGGLTAARRMEQLAPDYLHELMAQFVEKKELVDRQKVRRRIRALLDLFSADTMWPKGENAPPGGPRPFGGGFAQGPMFHDGGGPRGRREPDDLAEPADVGVQPAPGADLAQAGMGG